MNFIQKFEPFIQRKKPGKCGRLLLGVLYILSLGFKTVVILRNFLYDTGTLKKISVLLPVISIGNITAGGTGKTPFVLFFVRDLLEKRKVVVLNSGYKAELDNNKSRVVTSCKMGDEAFMIHAHFKDKVPVISGRNRIQSAHCAQLLNPDLLVLDDGMQHRKMHRDLEIVTIDSKNPLGGGHFLPRGYLRDLPYRLKNVDLLVINDIDSRQEFLKIEKTLREYTKAPIVGMKRRIHNSASFCPGEKVALFCGIAKPEAFIEMVKRELKVNLVCKKVLLDHEKMSEKELAEFIRKTVKAGAIKIICTEKDFVHYKNKEREIPIIPIELDLSISFGEVAYSKMLQKAVTLA